MRPLGPISALVIGRLLTTTLLVAGLTGSGKTSATKLVAERLRYQWISGSDLRRRFVGLGVDDGDVSRLGQALSEANLRLEEARLRSASGESEFDAELLRLATSLDNVVFDVWFLPWLVCDHPVVRALLHASPQARAQRVARMMGIDAVQAAAIITEKDQRAWRYALKQYGIDIKRDHTPFNAVIETDNLTILDVVSRLSDLVERSQGIGRE